MIVLVDDDDTVRTAIGRLLESAGYSVKAYADPNRCLDDPAVANASCIILDLMMPGVNGIEIQERLLKRKNHPPFVFLTGYGRVKDSVRALSNGAVDFLEKPVDEADLLSAVDKATNLDQLRRKRWQSRERIRDLMQSLTPRENEVMRRVADGASNKVIAFDLGISIKTVKIHRGRGMRKLSVKTVPELVRLLDLAAGPGV